MNLRFSTRSIDHAVHVEVEGTVSRPGFLPEDDEPLASLIGPDAYSKKVLLHLGKTTFLDSSGIGWLISCHKRFRDRNGTLIVHSAPPMVRQVFRLMNLDAVLRVADDERSARAMVERPPT